MSVVAQPSSPRALNPYNFSQPLQETLEWSVADSPLVVHVAIEPSPPDQLICNVIEVIKGDIARGSIVNVETGHRLKTGEPPRFAPGQTALLFLEPNLSRQPQHFPSAFEMDATESSSGVNRRY